MYMYICAEMRRLRYVRPEAMSLRKWLKPALIKEGFSWYRL